MAAANLRAGASTYQQPQESSLGRRQKRSLNPIIEEDDDDTYIPFQTMNFQGGRADVSHLKIEAWLSPMSDHFPTPRGVHYLSAPVLPSSPSTETATDPSPTTSLNPWNRASIATDATEFEDLYDVSDEEDDGPKEHRHSRSSRGKLALAIPPARKGSWPGMEDLKKMASPVPLTPSAQLTMSPAQLDFMGKHQALEVPTISAPPSLDGSLNSDQLATMSAPPTPVIGNDDITTDEVWSGVHLQPGALATLNALSGGDEEAHERPEQVLEIRSITPEAIPEMRQQPLRLLTNFRSFSAPVNSITMPNPHRQSVADLSNLEIPSPGGFFQALSPRTRNTWHTATKGDDDVVPPTSTTAEQFYRAPWNLSTTVPPVPKVQDSVESFYRNSGLSTAPIEQIVEVTYDELEDDMPTARPIIQHQISDSSTETIKAPVSPDTEDAPKEIVVDYDATYARQQQEVALGNLDRTELWLLAQRAYLKGVDNAEDDGALSTIPEAIEEEEEEVEEAETEVKQALVPKKSVRFSTDLISTVAQPKRLPLKLLRSESAYYRAFQDYVVKTHLSDVFVHQRSRFEALQAQRVSLRDAHRSQLLGKYQLSVVPQSAKKRLSANVARDDHTLIDDPEKLRLEKEFEAMSQSTMSMWHVAAMKFLNGGRLVSAPVGKRLARLSQLAPSKDGVTRDRARVLDLGGQATCDWAWHCALQYPNTKIYTVTTKAIRQLSNSNIRGPPNHRQVAVERLNRLPFADNQFDLVSARELHSILKIDGENGQDEWENCLHECMRVLKPGGFLEFSLLDSDIMNAGPLGLAKSVEFGLKLKTLGYDPSPSKMWLGRLARAGFQDVRRGWMCLPLGPKRSTLQPPTPPMKDAPLGQETKTLQMDAFVTGSTDNIASVCSIAGGWSWERWLLRCEMEKVSGELRLADTVTTGAMMEEAGKCLDDVARVMEEGRNHRAGFRMLHGYAMKPKAGTELIQIALEN